MRKMVRVLAVSLSLFMTLTACGSEAGSQSFGGSQGGGQTADIQKNPGSAQTLDIQGNSDGFLFCGMLGLFQHKGGHV